MAHEVERMAFTGETPWHGEGDTFSNPLDVDTCMAEAGLDYEALIGAAYDQSGAVIPFARSIVRSTDGRCVGVVGNAFKPLQCSQIAAFLKPWVETGRASMETAGNLRDGRVAWALAKLGEFDVGDGDLVTNYLLVAHAHDGTMAIRAGLTPVRVVCKNTLGGAISHAEGQKRGRGGEASGGLVKIHHTSGAGVNLDQVAKAIEIADGQWQGLTAAWASLRQRPVVNEQQVRAFAAAVWNEDLAPDGTYAKTKRAERCVELFETGVGNGKNTLWDLLNAATEMITHDSPTKTGAAATGARVDSLSFGTKRRELDRALDVARVMDRQIPIEAVFPKGSEVLDRVQEEVWRAA